jgi:ribosome-binding factor A
MASPPRRRRTTSSARGYDRADRLSELLREIVAETLERIDDDRLQLVTITAVAVDRELDHAKIYYTCLDGDDLADDVVEGFAEVRGRLRKAIGVQAKVRRVPNLTFLPDDVLRGAQRIEQILATMPRLPDEEPAVPTVPAVDPAAAAGIDPVAADDGPDDGG